MALAPVFITILVLCYLIGSIPFGLIAGRLAGIDIRQHGSANIGATNVWRVLGKKWGLPVFLLDVAKGLLAAVLAKWLASAWGITVPLPHLHTEVIHLETSLGGIAGSMAAIVGHNFPIWLRGKGGKGVATSLGVLFGLMPVASTITFLMWGLMLKVTRYVSLASILAALSLPLSILALFVVPLPWGMRGWPYFYFGVAATVLLVLRHAPNIKRLIAGTERRWGDPKEPAVGPADPPTVQVAQPSDRAPSEPVIERPPLKVIDAEIVRDVHDPRAE